MTAPVCDVCHGPIEQLTTGQYVHTAADYDPFAHAHVPRPEAAAWAIRYRYPGTVNGQPVGMVYAVNIGHLSPGSWSYTIDIDKATTFASKAEAEAAARRKYWPEARAVPA